MINVEIKARCSDQDRIREVLKIRNARFHGLDHQIDTYFNIGSGKRLKLRKGNIENSLIFYEREDSQGPKKSEVILYQDPASPLKNILSKAMGVLVVVDKQREIYLIDNVKFHIDTVQGLGSFIEIEAMGKSGEETRLLRQCQAYLTIFKIADEQLIASSYSDLLIKSLNLLRNKR